MGDPLWILVILLANWLGNRTYSGAGAPRGAPTEKGAVFIRQLLFFCNKKSYTNFSQGVDGYGCNMIYYNHSNCNQSNYY